MQFHFTPKCVWSFCLLTLVVLTLNHSAVASVPLPTIPATVFYATNYGAVGDGVANNAVAIQNAINAASTAGGGTVEITAAAGNYMCGPLTLKSSINFQVDAGATLQMLPVATWPGSTTFINGSSLHDVEISGSGTIDGNAHFGTGEWWGPVGGSAHSSRPNFINFGSSTRILIQNLTLQNPPTFHLMLKGNNASITIQGININTDPTSPNTDGMDLGSTNMLIQNCHITDGDDNIEIGGSSAAVADVTITNCMFGHGHGVSVGSLIQAGVANVTVINCTFTNTDYAIRLKSDNDRGGMVQNMSYYNLGMTNIKYAPILIYSYYNATGSPSNDGDTPAVVEGIAVGTPTTTMPSWRNIIISNVTATAAQPGMIWPRTEWPATNITLCKLNITSTDAAAGDSAFAIYNARGVSVVDCQIHMAGSKSFELFNAQVTFTNTATGASVITLDGAAVTNALAFYNLSASLTDSSVFGANPISLGGTTLTVSNHLTLVGTSVLNFLLGTNTDTIVVKTNLTFAGTVNVSAGGGFVGGTYTLATYGGSLTWSSPVLGTTPAGYSYTFNTNTFGQVKLVVTAPAPAAPTNLIATATNLLIKLKWNSVAGATSYDLKRGTTSGTYPAIFSGLSATNYADANVTNAVNYFYVVTAVAGGESTNSLPANAIPLPSNQPTNLVAQASGGQLQLSWPQDHLGWHLQIQTNSPGNGLSTNWFVYAGSGSTNQILLPIVATNASVFLRLTYP
jgi:polygalacturonase